MFTVRARISNAESLRYVLDRVAVEVKRLHADLPNTLETTRRKLDLAERRVANFVACIGDGKGTRALGQALETSETELEQLRGELAALEGTARATFAPPPIEWIAERMRPLGELLGRQTARSALVLRRILGPVRLRPVRPQVGRPYYQAETALEVLDLLDVASREAGTSEGGSNWYRKWRRGELNPRPKALDRKPLHA